MYNSPNFYSYQNPSYYSYFKNPQPKISFLSKLKTGVNWGSLLNNTSKTLNLINQAIPVYYQIRPLIKNCSTLFKIADIIKTDEKEEKQENKVSQNANLEKQKEDYNKSSSGLTFFL